MKGKGGKLATMRQNNAECITLMKTFCLNPAAAVAQRLSECNAVTRCEWYSTWHAMLPAHVIDVTDVASHNMKRELAYRAMLAKVSSQPTKSGAMQQLYVFAATGWFPAIEKFYECMGDGRLPQSVRTELVQEYKQWKELYTSRIHELIEAHADHFTSRGIDRTTVDFTRFDVYQREYEQRKKEQSGK